MNNNSKANRKAALKAYGRTKRTKPVTTEFLILKTMPNSKDLGTRKHSITIDSHSTRLSRRPKVGGHKRKVKQAVVVVGSQPAHS